MTEVAPRAEKEKEPNPTESKGAKKEARKNKSGDIVVQKSSRLRA